MNPIYSEIKKNKTLTRIFLASLLLLTVARSAAQTFSIQSSTTFPNPTNNGRIVIADFDGDNDADVLYQTGTNGSAFAYAKSNSNGTFTSIAIGSSPFAGLSLPDAGAYGTYRPADFDGDGDIDLWVVANGTTGTYFRNDGSTFSSQPSTTFPNPSFNGRNIIADFDGDGDADILYQTAGNSSAFAYARSNGNGSFTSVAIGSSPFTGLTLPDAGSYGIYRTADFDGDGDIDIWVVANSSTGTYFRNDGSTFSSQPSTTFPNPPNNSRNIEADFDNDGDADILFQTGGNGSGFSYAKNNGNGTFNITVQASSPFAGVTLPDVGVYGTYITADFDGDGDIDNWTPVSAATGTYIMQNDLPPSLASTNPANNAPVVARLTNITLTFSETMTKNAGNITILKASDNSVVETINVTSGQVTGSGTSWDINPSVTLAANTTFAVRISAGAFLDASGVAYAGLSGSQFQFTTGVALPLYWVSVHAAYANEQVHINWKTANELNTSHFDIERSTDGVSFNSIGQITSANSAGEHSYAFDDKGVQHGYTYYYRLKQVDIDAQFNYSSLLRVTTGGERTAGLKISNNPVRSDMVLSITLPDAQKARLILVNAAGAILLERKENLQAGETLMTVRTSDLPMGVYYLVLYAGSNKLRTTLIKQ